MKSVSLCPYTRSMRLRYHPPLPFIDFLSTSFGPSMRTSELFKIITLVKVDRLQEFLVTHPNRTFVDFVLVLRGLREGFWPCASIDLSGYLITYDLSKPTPSNEQHAQFIGDFELKMHATHVIEQHGKYRHITNHSAGGQVLFSLNYMISFTERSPQARWHSKSRPSISTRSRRSQSHNETHTYQSRCLRSLSAHTHEPFWATTSIASAGGASGRLFCSLYLWYFWIAEQGDAELYAEVD